MPKIKIVSLFVNSIDYDGVWFKLKEKINNHTGGYICVANVHMVMEAFDCHEFKEIVNNAFLVVPDGMPLKWFLNHKGAGLVDRVAGPELTLRLCDKCQENNISIGLFGGTEDTLSRFTLFLNKKYPSLKITKAISPPFHPLTESENDRYIQEFVKSGTGIVFVGIGCPKQEKWMAEQQGKSDLIFIGVGAAFDFHSGSVAHAPKFIQKIGMEWFFRLLMEPRRLWKRYLYNNPRFIYQVLKSIIKNEAK